MAVRCNAYSELNDPIDQRERLRSRTGMWKPVRKKRSIRMKISECFGHRYASDRWYRLRYPIVWLFSTDSAAIHMTLHLPHTMKSIEK